MQMRVIDRGKFYIERIVYATNWYMLKLHLGVILIEMTLFLS
ncbi:hypothetical protein VRK_09270 [Vibrio sp. MEBiC08052]|nr:hypothetical protein VRK_09270 [Vibrio sp. MEBiC08052]